MLLPSATDARSSERQRESASQPEEVEVAKANPRGGKASGDQSSKTPSRALTKAKQKKRNGTIRNRAWKAAAAAAAREWPLRTTKRVEGPFSVTGGWGWGGVFECHGTLVGDAKVLQPQATTEVTRNGILPPLLLHTFNFHSVCDPG